MTWIMGGAIVGGALIGAYGSEKAGKQQAEGQEQAANTQAGMFNTLQKQEQPFINAGSQAETNLTNLMNPANAGEISNYISSLPGYQFQLQTGSQALRNQQTPGSGALSGQTMKSLMGFNQGLAGTFYNNYVQQLLGQAQIGAGAAGNLGSQGVGLGTGEAQAQAGAGASIAGGTVGAANSLGSAVPMSVLLSGGLGGSVTNPNWGGTPSSPGFSGAPYAGGS